MKLIITLLTVLLLAPPLSLNQIGGLTALSKEHKK